VSDARILDRGYRTYDGPRLGPSGAVRSLVRHTSRRVLGIRRPARTKILPVLAAVIAYLPAIVFVGIAALIPDDRITENFLPTYGEYYGFITSALIVFAAFVAPEALCPDRRSGLLGLYLAAPLTRTTYVFGKIVSVFWLLLIGTLGPPLLLLVALTLQDQGPDGVGGLLLTLLRVVVSGVLVALVFTAVSLGISSLTDRRALASAGVLLTIILTGVVTGALVQGVGLPDWLFAFNLMFAPFELVQRLYGEPPDPEVYVSTPVLVLVIAGWIVLGLGMLWWRYQKVRVRR
jgi:ABC-2 type transport system permease protein